MRNQYMAKVLVHNKVVSEAQVKAHWGEITDKKDIGQVLVDAGILPPPMYIKVLAFVKNLEAKAAAEGGGSAKAVDRTLRGSSGLGPVGSPCTARSLRRLAD